MTQNEERLIEAMQNEGLETTCIADLRLKYNGTPLTPMILVETPEGEIRLSLSSGAPEKKHTEFFGGDELDDIYADILDLY